MSKVNLSVLKPNNAPWQLMFTLSNDFYRRYDRFTIEVRHGNTVIYMLSTTEGSIKGHRVYVDGRLNTVSYCTSYDTSVKDIETIIVFYYQNDIVQQEILLSRIDYIDNSTSPKIRTIMPEITELNILDIGSLCKDETAAFKVKLEVLSDIRVDVTDANDVYMAFGDKSSVISASDLIFPVEASVSHISIPKEIVWMNYSLYSGDSLGCYELVKMDCLDHVYHKVPASNFIRLSDCIAKKDVNLSHFRTPISTRFGDTWEINQKSQLPCNKNG